MEEASHRLFNNENKIMKTQGAADATTYLHFTDTCNSFTKSMRIVG